MELAETLTAPTAIAETASASAQRRVIDRIERGLDRLDEYIRDFSRRVDTLVEALAAVRVVTKGKRRPGGGREKIQIVNKAAGGITTGLREVSPAERDDMEQHLLAYAGYERVEKAAAQLHAAIGSLEDEVPDEYRELYRRLRESMALADRDRKRASKALDQLARGHMAAETEHLFEKTADLVLDAMKGRYYLADRMVMARTLPRSYAIELVFYLSLFDVLVDEGDQYAHMTKYVVISYRPTTKTVHVNVLDTAKAPGTFRVGKGMHRATPQALAKEIDQRFQALGMFGSGGAGDNSAPPIDPKRFPRKGHFGGNVKDMAFSNAEAAVTFYIDSTGDLPKVAKELQKKTAAALSDDYPRHSVLYRTFDKVNRPGTDASRSVVVLVKPPWAPDSVVGGQLREVLKQTGVDDDVFQRELTHHIVPEMLSSAMEIEETAARQSTMEWMEDNRLANPYRTYPMRPSTPMALLRRLVDHFNGTPLPPGDPMFGMARRIPDVSSDARLVFLAPPHSIWVEHVILLDKTGKETVADHNTYLYSKWKPSDTVSDPTSDIKEWGVYDAVAAPFGNRVRLEPRKAITVREFVEKGELRFTIQRLRVQSRKKRDLDKQKRKLERTSEAPPNERQPAPVKPEPKPRQLKAQPVDEKPKEETSGVFENYRITSDRHWTFDNELMKADNPHEYMARNYRRYLLSVGGHSTVWEHPFNRQVAIKTTKIADRCWNRFVQLVDRGRIPRNERVFLPEIFQSSSTDVQKPHTATLVELLEEKTFSRLSNSIETDRGRLSVVFLWTVYADPQYPYPEFDGLEDQVEEAARLKGWTEVSKLVESFRGDWDDGNPEANWPAQEELLGQSDPFARLVNRLEKTSGCSVDFVNIDNTMFRDSTGTIVLVDPLVVG